jgi:hypothetical protein
MSSGVVPNEHCKPAFDRVRTGKIKFVTFKIDDNAEKTEVCVEGAKQVSIMRQFLLRERERELERDLIVFFLCARVFRDLW